MPANAWDSSFQEQLRMKETKGVKDMPGPQPLSFFSILFLRNEEIRKPCKIEIGRWTVGGKCKEKVQSDLVGSAGYAVSVKFVWQ